MAVLIGGVSVYLGFRLFLAIPNSAESQGKLILPGGISIYLTRIGPGAFFALFGALVVATSFRQAISYQEGSQTTILQGQSKGQATAAEKNPSEESHTFSSSYTGLGDVPDDLPLARKQAALDIILLNTRIVQTLEGNAPQLKHADVEPLIRRMKMALVKSVWDAKWGDFGKFKAWVEDGAAGPAPNQVAARLFMEGQI